MQTEIVNLGNGFYNAVIKFEPRKRTINYLNTYNKVDFNFTTVFIIPIFQYKNTFVKSGDTLIGANPKYKNEDSIYPFKFPHLGPTNMKFCVYKDKEDTFFDSIDDLIKHEINTFWNSVNTSYMNDDFSIEHSENLEPIKICLAIKKSINELKNSFHRNNAVIRSLLFSQQNLNIEHLRTAIELHKIEGCKLNYKTCYDLMLNTPIYSDLKSIKFVDAIIEHIAHPLPINEKNNCIKTILKCLVAMGNKQMIDYLLMKPYKTHFKKLINELSQWNDTNIIFITQYYSKYVMKNTVKKCMKSTNKNSSLFYLQKLQEKINEN